MKIALGTAQFGLDYGAFGNQERINPIEVCQILKFAREAGICTLDTARVYGDAEEVVGNTGESKNFDIVTKCPKLPSNCDAEEFVLESLDASCKALGVPRVCGYILHDAKDLDRPGVLAALQKVRNSGRAEHIGISAYGYDEALHCCENHPLSLVQLPGNVLDPWFRDSNFPRNIEVHVRSVFLQGFLLCDPEKLPPYFRRWKDILAKFRARAESHGLSPLQAALAPLIQSPAVDRVVVGIESIRQLRSILSASRALADSPVLDLGELPTVSEELVDPRKWHCENFDE